MIHHEPAMKMDKLIDSSESLLFVQKLHHVNWGNSEDDCFLYLWPLIYRCRFAAPGSGLESKLLSAFKSLLRISALGCRYLADIWPWLAMYFIYKQVDWKITKEIQDIRQFDVVDICFAYLRLIPDSSFECSTCKSLMCPVPGDRVRSYLFRISQ